MATNGPCFRGDALVNEAGDDFLAGARLGLAERPWPPSLRLRSAAPRTPCQAGDDSDRARVGAIAPHINEFVLAQYLRHDNPRRRCRPRFAFQRTRRWSD